MNPVSFTYKGETYEGFRNELTTDMQMSLYGAHDAVAITIGIPRSELKAEIKQGEKVIVFAPLFGRTGRELWVIGIREDAAGLSARMDLAVRYNNG